MTLTEEQKQRIEQNRLAAIRRREELAKQRAQAAAPQPPPSVQPNRNLTVNNQRLNQPTGNNPTTNLPTNSNGINRQFVNSASSNSNQPKYTFNRIANAVANVGQNSRPNPQTNNQLTNRSNFNQPPNRQPSNNPPASYGSNSAATSFAVPSANQPNRPSVNQNSSVYQNSNPNSNQNSNQTSNYITPAKRPAGSSDNLRESDKRLKTGPQTKSPYEQVMSKAQTIEIKFYLLNNKEFYIDFPFNQRLINEIKALNQARFERTKKVWIFRLENYQETLDKLAAIKLDRLIIKLGEGFPKHVLEILEDSLRYDTIKVDLESKPTLKNVLKRLFPYQKEGVIFGVKREGRCLIADDMGLGKTMQAIALALYYFDEWPLLVVCPASVKFQWVAALLDWVPGLERDDILEIDSKKRDPAGKSHLVVITSYDSILKVEQHLRKGVNCAILDECHMIKESSTQRFHNIAKLAGKAKRLILVSGTPAMSRPIELFTQLKLLLPKIFSNKNKYATRYCDPKDTPWGRQYTGCTRPEELRVILESTVMVRRMKGDIMNELPPKRRVKVNLDAHIVGHDRSEIEKFNSRFKGPQEVKMNDDEALMNAYAKTAEIKLKPVLNYLELVLEKGKKFIIFAYHRAMIDGVCEFLAKKKITFIKIDGSTPTKDRQEGCELFQGNANCKAAVLSIAAAGVGLTLTAAQLVLFAELYFNPGALIQAEDRVHRIGQKDSVYIEYLICPGTTDDGLWSMVHRKLETLDSLGIQSDGFQVKSQNATNSLTNGPPSSSSAVPPTINLQ